MGFVEAVDSRALSHSFAEHVAYLFSPSGLSKLGLIAAWVAFWTLLCLVACVVPRIGPSRAGFCVSAIHAVSTFSVATMVLVRRRGYIPFYAPLDAYPVDTALCAASLGYFIYDMYWVLTKNRAFLAHHLVCIVDFASLLLIIRCCSTHGVANLFVAELGGLAFQAARLYPCPASRTAFHVAFVVTRAGLWPVYLGLMTRAFLAEATCGWACAALSVGGEALLWSINVVWLLKTVFGVDILWRLGLTRSMKSKAPPSVPVRDAAKPLAATQ
ncbi:hypothetical protein BU14_0022s0051 [Porphyra umbilicalis]|uniref:TLC domain-containing protein n=1 Tax=Porphyra umbilicalis TaxID=2786 RepID=A0A1X6PKD5_PORUM|nr:hypothetical protein BU14_0022s0051 [Porphyra umbilicalis]|eukprot:OSX81331.1 hypothetical protein BU14_0022s0051 [Porphyra umbilicalis]